MTWGLEVGIQHSYSGVVDDVQVLVVGIHQ